MAVTRRQISGINTDANPRVAPEGALEAATNVVCRRVGLIEPRPGLHQGATISALADAQRIVPYDGDIVAIDDTETVQLSSGNNVTNQDYGAGQLAGYDGLCGAVEARGNLYMATQDGVQKVLSSSATGAFMAGEHQFVELVVASTDNSANAAENWLANNDGCAYRVVLRTEDGNGVITRSAPSTPYFIVNTDGAARRVLVRVHLDDEGYYSNTWAEVYRTKSNAVGVPSDSYFLTMETRVTVGYLSIGYIDFYDTKPNNELGRALYSNQSQEARVYSPPRRGKVLGKFAGSVFNGNLTSPQYKFVDFKITAPQSSSVTANMSFNSGSQTATLNSQTANYNGAVFVEGMFIYVATYLPNGALVTGVSGSTITLDTNASATGAGIAVEAYDTVTITDGTTTEVYQSYFVIHQVMSQVAAAFPPLQDGPSSLVYGRFTRGYNSLSGSTDYSYYLEELPGTTATLQIKATNAAARYNNEINEHSSGFGDFDQDTEPALVEWSVLDQPETFVRGIEQVYVGNRDKAVWSMLESGRRLYITKADEGIYVLDGETQRSGFRLEQLTQQHKPMSPRHICQGADGLFVWTDQGVVEIGSGGAIKPISAQVVSNKLRHFRADETSLLGNMFFAGTEVHLLARQTLESIERSVHLVYNTQTRQWTEWSIVGPAVIGCSPGRTVYGDIAKFAILTNDSGDLRLWQEPKFLSDGSSDLPVECGYGDVYSGTVSVTATPAASGDFYTITASFSAFQVVPNTGDFLISHGEEWKGVVTGRTDNGGGSYTLTFYSADTVVAASTTIYFYWAYDVTIRFRQISSDNPLYWQHWMSAHFELVGPMSLYQAQTSVLSSEGESNASPSTQTSRTYPVYTQPSADGPAQAGWQPRYLPRPKHANAISLRPELVISEGGAVWALAAVSLHEARGSIQTHRDIS